MMMRERQMPVKARVKDDFDLTKADVLFPAKLDPGRQRLMGRADPAMDAWIASLLGCTLRPMHAARLP